MKEASSSSGQFWFCCSAVVIGLSHLVLLCNLTGGSRKTGMIEADMRFVKNFTPPDFQAKILHRQFHLISTV